MNRERVRDAIAVGAITLGFGALLFGPGSGTIALSPFTFDFANRVVEHYPPGEQHVLDMLDCFAESLAQVPDGASVAIRAKEDPYAIQRISGIAFPRLDVVAQRDADYTILVTPNDDSHVDSPDALESRDCGERVIEVISNG